jgi:hypothetical protein
MRRDCLGLEAFLMGPVSTCQAIPKVGGMTNLVLNNDVEMPALGLGVFQTPPDETREAVEAALATGYRHIDTAAAYGNAREVGQAVRSSGVTRGEVLWRPRSVS